MNFILNNEQRKVLGLESVQENWTTINLKNQMIVFLDNKTIVKVIEYSETEYTEYQLSEIIDEDGLILPKTNKGKPKKLSYSSVQSCHKIGIYFKYETKAWVNYAMIGNHTTQKTFYSTNFEEINIDTFEKFSAWLHEWQKNFSEKDFFELETFKNETRHNIDIKEGDFFVFKVDKTNFGFGRVLLNIRKLKKDKNIIGHYGLLSLMGQPLAIKIYHKINPSKNINLSELKQKKSIPAQYIMDNRLFYGDYEVIGNQPLNPEELDFPIHYNNNIKDKKGEVFSYLQYGLLYLETNNPTFDTTFNISYRHYLDIDKESDFMKYHNSGIGFDLRLNKKILESCIEKNSNLPYWEDNRYYQEDDLRNPKNQKHLDLIFNFFELDSQKTYTQNKEKREK
mgnify:CR=1 FL=1